MKIAFDGQLFLKGNKTGIAWNAHNLILELSKYPENECVIQCFSHGYSKEQLHQLDEYKKAGCQIEYCTWFSQVMYKLLWNFIPIPYSLFFKAKPDITQFFNFVIPPGVKGKRITIVHDMAYMACPQTVRKKTRDWLRLSMKGTCKRADHIITVSEFSKKEIVKYLQVPSEKITVVPNAVDHSLYHTNYSQEQVEQVLKKYHICGEYFLYLGTIEPRKNIKKLILSYIKLCEKGKNVPHLVIAGGKGWYYNEIYDIVKKNHLQNKVLFIGYVGQQDSPILMKGAIAFVFPSLYEGFGMPPLEAMACGTPVITSNSTSFPEVVGDAGILIDPEKPDEICYAMQKIMEDETYRKRMGKMGEHRAEGFTWKNSACRVMEIYRENYN